MSDQVRGILPRGFLRLLLSVAVPVLVLELLVTAQYLATAYADFLEFPSGLAVFLSPLLIGFLIVWISQTWNTEPWCRLGCMLWVGMLLVPWTLVVLLALSGVMIFFWVVLPILIPAAMIGVYVCLGGSVSGKKQMLVQIGGGLLLALFVWIAAQHGTILLFALPPDWAGAWWWAMTTYILAMVLMARILVCSRTARDGGAPDLHAAARDGKDEAVSALIRKGEDVDATDENGMTPLHLATANGHHHVAKVLIENGAKIDCRDRSKRTPLHHAALLHDTAYAEILTELLLSHKADVHAISRSGATPLCLAADRGHRRLVELLIAHGADVNAKTTTGLTALRFAEEGGHVEIADLLRQHGAETEKEPDE